MLNGRHETYRGIQGCRVAIQTILDERLNVIWGPRDVSHIWHAPHETVSNSDEGVVRRLVLVSLAKCLHVVPLSVIHNFPESNVGFRNLTLLRKFTQLRDRKLKSSFFAMA